MWKRQSAHSDAKQGSKHLGRVHETIFLYSASADYHSKHLYRSCDSDYVENFYKHTELAGNGVLLGTVWDDITPEPGKSLTKIPASQLIG